jgi:hypothetical protein
LIGMWQPPGRDSVARMTLPGFARPINYSFVNEPCKGLAQ